MLTSIHVILVVYLDFCSQESEDFEESNHGRNNNKIEYGEESDCPISSPPSYSGGSCNSLDSKISYTSNGNVLLRCFLCANLVTT